MSGILLVERSTTLNHLLRRTLEAASLPVRLEIGGYLEACETMRRVGASTSTEPPFSLAIIGAPARATREFSALLEFVRDAPEAPATLLMAHEETPEIRAWSAATLRGRCLLWSQFSRIPASVAELAPEEVPAGEVEVAAAHRIRVLFVDDSRTVCQAYSDLLERNGFSVDVAGSIAEADALAQANHYDMAVVDYFLPDGSGDELCRRLCERRDAPLVAVITGSYREDIIRRCLQAGAGECMFKNEARELFLARIRTLARTIEMRRSAAQEREQLDGILGTVGDGVFGVDADGRISFVNPTGLRLLGFNSDEELVGLLVQASIHPLGAPRGSTLSRAYADGVAAQRIETMFRRRDGSGFPVEYTALPISRDGRNHGAVVIFRDIAERRTAERLRWELNNDPLTGLPNARHLRQRLMTELGRLRERGGNSALIHIEVLRDAEDQSVRGDEMVRTVAQVLAHRLREGDVLARGEGDGFELLLSQVQVDSVDVLVNSFRKLLVNREYHVGESRYQIHVRIGALLLDAQTIDADAALAAACQAAADDDSTTAEVAASADASAGATATGQESSR